MAVKKLRILVDHTVDEKKYLIGNVVEIDAAQATSLVDAGIADDNKAAVAYALEQNGGQVLKHKMPVAPPPEPPEEPPVAPDLA